MVYAPDGGQYNAVWGKIMSVNSDEETLGIRTNDRSSNWYLVVGTKKNHVIIAGCRIHYATRCEKRPKTEAPYMIEYNGDINYKTVSSKIYHTE